MVRSEVASDNYTAIGAGESGDAAAGSAELGAPSGEPAPAEAKPTGRTTRARSKS
jgi:hypothetical protein